jgi:hypothetical protein
LESWLWKVKRSIQGSDFKETRVRDILQYRSRFENNLMIERTTVELASAWVAEFDGTI